MSLLADKHKCEILLSLIYFSTTNRINLDVNKNTANERRIEYLFFFSRKIHNCCIILT